VVSQQPRLEAISAQWKEGRGRGQNKNSLESIDPHLGASVSLIVKCGAVLAEIINFVAAPIEPSARS
jgi:hypothetical protein